MLNLAVIARIVFVSVAYRRQAHTHARARTYAQTSAHSYTSTGITLTHRCEQIITHDRGFSHRRFTVTQDKIWDKRQRWITGCHSVYRPIWWSTEDALLSGLRGVVKKMNKRGRRIEPCRAPQVRGHSWRWGFRCFNGKRTGREIWLSPEECSVIWWEQWTDEGRNKWLGWQCSRSERRSSAVASLTDATDTERGEGT